MLATADCANHYTEQIVYESSWTDNTSNGISWFNLLTSEPIPEETDITDISHTPVRNNSGRSCSTSSIESCYVVLEIQRPRLNSEILETVESYEEEEVDDDDDEEEMEEEMEEFHFAQINTDERHVDCEQLTVSLTIEIPKEDYAVEHIQERVHEVEEYAKVTQPIIQESSNEILFDKAKSLSKFTKRMKATSSTMKKEQHLSISSDDEPLNMKTVKTIERINENQSTINSLEQPLKSPDCRSNTSLDSIETKLSPPVPIQVRTTTTFSTLSTQRTSNPLQIQRSGPKMGTTTLTRTFAFDRACMEKYGQDQQQEQKLKPKPVPMPTVPVTETSAKKDIGLPPRQSKPTEIFSFTNNASNICSLNTPTSNHSFINDETMTMNSSMYTHQSPLPSMTFGSHSLSKTSSVLCLMKKCARTITSEYRLTTNNDDLLAEPKLLQVTYLDGRLPLKDDQIGELPLKSHTLSSSIASRLNKVGLSKMSSTQDLPGSTLMNGSYRKSVFSRFRSLLENNPNEPSQSSRPWQHKTIVELFNERKQKQ